MHPGEDIWIQHHGEWHQGPATKTITSTSASWIVLIPSAHSWKTISASGFPRWQLISAVTKGLLIAGEDRGAVCSILTKNKSITLPQWKTALQLQPYYPLMRPGTIAMLRMLTWVDRQLKMTNSCRTPKPQTWLDLSGWHQSLESKRTESTKLSWRNRILSHKPALFSLLLSSQRKPV